VDKGVPISAPIPSKPWTPSKFFSFSSLSYAAEDQYERHKFSVERSVETFMRLLALTRDDVVCALRTLTLTPQEPVKIEVSEKREDIVSYSPVTGEDILKTDLFSLRVELSLDAPRRQVHVQMNLEKDGAPFENEKAGKQAVEFLESLLESAGVPACRLSGSSKLPNIPFVNISTLPVHPAMTYEDTVDLFSGYEFCDAPTTSRQANGISAVAREDAKKVVNEFVAKVGQWILREGLRESVRLEGQCVTNTFTTKLRTGSKKTKDVNCHCKLNLCVEEKEGVWDVVVKCTVTDVVRDLYEGRMIDNLAKFFSGYGKYPRGSVSIVSGDCLRLSFSQVLCGGCVDVARKIGRQKGSVCVCLCVCGGGVLCKGGW
jgi:hypothetical protein